MPKLPPGIIKKGTRPGYYYRDQKGGSDRLVKAGETVQDARRFVEKARARNAPASSLTVKEAAKRWLERVVVLRRNEKGRALAELRAARYLVRHMGHRPVLRLTADDCRGYRLFLEGEKIAPQTVAHVLADLRAMLLWLEDEGVYARTPFPRRLLPRIAQRPPDRLAGDVAEKLADLPDPYGFTVRLLLGTGLRWSEATRSEARHVEKGSLVIGQSKSGRVRRVPLALGLLHELRARVGRLVPFSSVSSFNRTIRNKADLEAFHVHQLRHTFACQYLERGGQLAALKEILGHASIETTMRYAALMDEVVRRDAERTQRA